jgi:3-methyladenine DNA glycosylase Tag
MRGGGSLDAYLWAYVDGKPILNHGERIVTTPLSDRISKDLRQRGFKFVGSTIIYAYMQAIGMVQDHAADCDWRQSCGLNTVISPRNQLISADADCCVVPRRIAGFPLWIA